MPGLPYRSPYCARHGRRAFQDLAGWQRRNAEALSSRRASVDPLDIRHVLDGVEELPE